MSMKWRSRYSVLPHTHSQSQSQSYSQSQSQSQSQSYSHARSQPQPTFFQVRWKLITSIVITTWVLALTLISLRTWSDRVSQHRIDSQIHSLEDGNSNEGPPDTKCDYVIINIASTSLHIHDILDHSSLLKYALHQPSFSPRRTCVLLLQTGESRREGWTSRLLHHMFEQIEHRADLKHVVSRVVYYEEVAFCTSMDHWGNQNEQTKPQCSKKLALALQNVLEYVRDLKAVQAYVQYNVNVDTSAQRVGDKNDHLCRLDPTVRAITSQSLLPIHHVDIQIGLSSSALPSCWQESLDLALRPTFASLDHLIASVISLQDKVIPLFPPATQITTIQPVSSIFFAVLAGSKNFAHRVQAVTSTWANTLSTNRVAFFTDSGFQLDDSIPTILGAFKYHIVQPSSIAHERYALQISSWSHLVRIRESWSLYMSHDTSIHYLALVDDDTYVYPESLLHNLQTSMPDFTSLSWGGFLEVLRVDNGDSANFALWTRDIYHAKSGLWCLLPMVDQDLGDGSTIPQCRDVFCQVCQPIPQGGTVILSRALVESLVPLLSECERATNMLCEKCGSQRLYMCVEMHFSEAVHTVWVPGVYRNSWRYEYKHRTTDHRHTDGNENESRLVVASFHGMAKEYGARSTAARDMFRDFAYLYAVQLAYYKRLIFSSPNVSDTAPFATMHELDQWLVPWSFTVSAART